MDELPVLHRMMMSLTGAAMSGASSSTSMFSSPGAESIAARTAGISSVLIVTMRTV